MKNILVTGGAGYIGSILISQLAKDETINKIISIDNLSRGDYSYLQEFIKINDLKNKVELIEGELLDEKYLDTYLPGCTAVIHLAAAVGEKNCEDNPTEAIDNNIKLVLLVLQKMKENNVKKIVFASSQVVYGTSKELPFSENLPKKPNNFYAYTKAHGEDLIEYFAKKWNLQAAIFRLASVYGFGLYARWGSVTGNFSKLAITGKNIPIFSDGEQKADFIHVKDVANAMHTCINSDKASVWNTAYNLGTGVSMSINQLADIFISLSAEKFRHKIKKEYVDPDREEVKERRLDMNKLKENLNWTPTTSMEQGIGNLIEEYKKAHDL